MLIKMKDIIKCYLCLSLITLVFFCPMVLINQAKLQSVQNHLFFFSEMLLVMAFGSRFLKAFRSEVISEH